MLLLVSECYVLIIMITLIIHIIFSVGGWGGWLTDGMMKCGVAMRAGTTEMELILKL